MLNAPPMTPKFIDSKSLFRRNSDDADIKFDIGDSTSELPSSVNKTKGPPIR